jgi:hypothetical protein
MTELLQLKGARNHSHKFPYLQAAKYQVKDEASNVITRNVIKSCLLWATAHLRGEVMSMEHW